MSGVIKTYTVPIYGVYTLNEDIGENDTLVIKLGDGEPYTYGVFDLNGKVINPSSIKVDFGNGWAYIDYH